MMRKNVYLIVWLMTVILYSCYDDKGNYSYEDIDEISIAGMPDTLVTVFKNTDTLKVVPELKHTLAAGSGKYEYTWVAVAKENKTGNEFEYEIGKEKNLNYFIVFRSFVFIKNSLCFFNKFFSMIVHKIFRLIYYRIITILSPKNLFR